MNIHSSLLSAVYKTQINVNVEDVRIQNFQKQVSYNLNGFTLKGIFLFKIICLLKRKSAGQYSILILRARGKYCLPYFYFLGSPKTDIVFNELILKPI